MEIKNPKVSFIDKRTMCAVDPKKVCGLYLDDNTSTLAAYYDDKDGKEIELEIKFLEYV